MVNILGALVETREYDPFGREVAHTGDYALKHQYTQQPRDTENGLDHYGARMYSAKWGRFLSADPLVSALSSSGLNRYAYVGNDPMSRTDPTGMCSTELGGICFSLGFYFAFGAATASGKVGGGDWCRSGNCSFGVFFPRRNDSGTYDPWAFILAGARLIGSRVDLGDGGKAEPREVHPDEVRVLTDNELSAITRAARSAAWTLNRATDEELRTLIPELRNADRIKMLEARYNIRKDLGELGIEALRERLGRTLAEVLGEAGEAVVLAPTRLLGKTGKLIRAVDTFIEVGEGAAGILNRAKATVSCSAAGCIATVE